MLPTFGRSYILWLNSFFAIQTNLQTNLRDGPPAPHYSISVVGSHGFDTENWLRRLFHTPIPYLLQGVKSPTFGLDFLRQSLWGDCAEQCNTLAIKRKLSVILLNERAHQLLNACDGPPPNMAIWCSLALTRELVAHFAPPPWKIAGKICLVVNNSAAGCRILLKLGTWTHLALWVHTGRRIVEFVHADVLWASSMSGSTGSFPSLNSSLIATFSSSVCCMFRCNM